MILPCLASPLKLPLNTQAKDRVPKICHWLILSKRRIASSTHWLHASPITAPTLAVIGD
jgi:hypothetical protein